MEVNATESADDKVKAYAAGAVEVHASFQLIEAHVFNTYYWDCVYLSFAGPM